MSIRQKQSPGAVDESAESEITIHADGRVFGFGITRGLASVLASIPTADRRVAYRLRQISRLNADSHQAASGTGESRSWPIP
jgi:hypothetical protein